MAWGKGSGRNRKACAVLPDDDDAGDGCRGVAKHAPRGRASPALAGIRWRSPRAWIWLLLVANLLLVLVFTFLSARYFPEVDSPDALLHRPPPSRRPPSPPPTAGEAPRLGSDGPWGERRGGGQQRAAPTGKTAVLPGAGRADAAESEPRGTSRLAAAETAVAASAVGIETAAAGRGAEPGGGPSEKEEEGGPAPPLALATDRPAATEPQTLPPHVAGMLARVKAAREPTTDAPRSSEPASGGATVPARGDGADTERGRALGSLVGDQEALQTELHQALFVWLEADEGVEVVDREACARSRNPDACELTSWRNRIRSTNSLVPTAFHPTSSLRPVWVPMVGADSLEPPAVAFSCPLKAKHASFPEAMTLFFVLSPAHIEEGDSYAGQKFFGSSPYGQFALHGGRPAFFGSTGLVERDEPLEPSRLAILAYRLQRESVEIRVLGRAWTPLPSEPRAIRLSQNAELSLGNAKPLCDTNAFRGHISEVMMYSVALDDERVEAVEQYLRKKYGGQASAVNDGEHSEPAPETEEPGEEIVRADTERMSDAPVATATEAAGGELGTGRDVKVEPPQPVPSPTRSEEPQEQPRPLDDYNPELVFEWVPSTALLAAKNLSPAAAEQWASAVRERVATIQAFQLGGDVLRAFIHEQKEELLRLHDDLFGPSAE